MPSPAAMFGLGMMYLNGALLFDRAAVEQLCGCIFVCCIYVSSVYHWPYVSYDTLYTQAR